MQVKIQGECQNTKQEFGQYILYLKLILKTRFAGGVLVAECSFDPTFILLPTVFSV